MPSRRTRTGGREATSGVIPGRFALSVGMPDLPAPEGWRWAPLLELATLESGHTPSRQHPEWWEGDIPWISLRDVTSSQGRVLWDTTQHTNEQGIENSSARLLPPLTVCVSRTASVGFVVVAGRPMATSQDFVNWICGDQLHWRYLKYIFQAEHESLRRFASGTTHQTIYYPEVKAFHVCIPPVEEQRQIASVLATFDEKIESNRRLARSLDDACANLFQRLVANRTNEWRDIPIGDAATIVGGSTPKTSQPAFWDGEHVFVTPRDLSDLEFPVLIDSARRITDAGVSEISSGLLPRGTVLMSSRAPIGYAAIAEVPVTVNQGFIALICDKDLPNHYVLHWLRASLQTIVAHAGGTTFAEISKKSFRPLEIPIPPPEILRQFEAVAGPFHDRIAAAVRESRDLAALRDLLIPQLISGQISLPTDYEPSFALEPVANV